jgi:hypothetical protein
VARDGLTHEIVPTEITPAAPGQRNAVTVRAPEYLLREYRQTRVLKYTGQREVWTSQESTTADS